MTGNKEKMVLLLNFLFMQMTYILIKSFIVEKSSENGTIFLK